MRFARYIRALYLILILWTAPEPAFSQDVEAVLSSGLGPYQAAFDGFVEGFGSHLSPIVLPKDSPHLSPETRVVVAFGAKAVLRSYPQNVSLVYCMAPGVRLGVGSRRGLFVEIQMLPQAKQVLAKIKEIQPGLKRLAIFWSSKEMKDYAEQIRQNALESSIAVLSERLDTPDEFPDRLRNVYGKIDAFWLLPDPPLVNGQSLSVLKEFSWLNHIPFYAPTAGFVEQGATASVSSSFREIGRTAGSVARQILSGKFDREIVYPETVEIVLSVSAGQHTGLTLAPEILKHADRVLP